jgi:hypothetical protein
MPKRYHDDWLRAFVKYASYGEAPLKMVFWSGISTLAGALRRRVWIDQKYFKWIPNFYVILVAPPGIVSKSTTANIGMNLLRKIPDIKFGPDVITWQQLVTSLASATQAFPDPRSGEMYPMSAVTFCSDELGNLLNPSDRDLVDALVSLWDGKEGTFKKETKTSGKDNIENPYVNIIGCTTPAWISGTFPEYMIGGGFTSRCVFVYADRKRQLIPYVDEVVSAEFEEIKRKLIHDLEIISMMFGAFEIDSEARDWGRQWYKAHWENPPPSLTTDQFSGYLARKQTHLHKLAMVLAASESSDTVIRKVHLEKSHEIVSATESDMPRVFARIGQTEITRGSFEIITLIENAGSKGITQTELYQHLFRTLSYKDFTDALTGAINTQKVRAVADGNSMRFFSTKGPQ